MRAADKLGLQIKGSVTLSELRDDTWVTKYEQPNLVVDLAYSEIFPEILGRAATIAVISIGEGGDYDQNGVFVGSRQAPQQTDQQMRLELFRAGIVNIQFPGPGEVEFIGLMREGEAISTNIDEFGLFTVDGRMIAHSINPESVPNGPTVKYTKPLGAIYSVSWKLEIGAC